MNKTVGVIVARFQTELTEGQKEFIDQVLGLNDGHLIIFLGISHNLCSVNNPLDFDIRAAMIREYYPEWTTPFLAIYPLIDQKDDKDWSIELDKKITECTDVSVTIYGNRHSFIPHYDGKYKTQLLDEIIQVTGTEIREYLRRNINHTRDFRHGVIWATGHQYPNLVSTVDVAIINEKQVLLGRKTSEKNFRFIGGHVDVTDKTLESAVRRELLEETGCKVSDISYIGSTVIDDWRHQSEPSQIMTSFFLAVYDRGIVAAKSDICEVQYFDLLALSKDDIEPEHHVLYDLLMSYLYEIKLLY